MTGPVKFAALPRGSWLLAADALFQKSTLDRLIFHVDSCGRHYPGGLISQTRFITTPCYPIEEREAVAIIMAALHLRGEDAWKRFYARAVERWEAEHG